MVNTDYCPFSGVGENARGTLLGAVDTVTNEGPTKNDEIARHGRLEMERGLANMKGHHHQPSHLQPPNAHGSGLAQGTYGNRTVDSTAYGGADAGSGLKAGK